MKIRLAVALLLLAPAPAPAHRLDEYLQEALISVDKYALHVEMTLTPGVAVFPMVTAEMDPDADGVVSEREQRAYGGQVLRDLSLTIDGNPLTPRLVSIRFPRMEEMKEGMGTIRIAFQADLPRGGPGRRLVLENHHQAKIGAYLVNCLLPSDPDIRIVAQNRNYSQSRYQLDYARTDIRSEALSLPWWPGDLTFLGAVALLLFCRLMLLWRRRPAASG